MSLLPFVFYNIEKIIIIIQVLNCQCNLLPNISLCCKKKVWSNVRVIKLRPCWVNLNKTESIRPISDWPKIFKEFSQKIVLCH